MFGVVDVGTESRKIVPLVNRSKRPMVVQLIDEGPYGGGALADNCVEFFPRHEVTVAPRETLNVQIAFTPTKRVSNFSEELTIRYAGLTRKLLVVSGKAQGNEVALGETRHPIKTSFVNTTTFCINLTVVLSQTLILCHHLTYLISPPPSPPSHCRC